MPGVEFDSNACLDPRVGYSDMCLANKQWYPLSCYVGPTILLHSTVLPSKIYPFIRASANKWI